MHIINSKLALKDFCSTTLLGAAYGFRVEDFLPPEEQLNIDRAFALLRTGVNEFYAQPKDKNQKMHELLDKSYTAFKAGDNKKGAEYIRSFEDEIV